MRVALCASLFGPNATLTRRAAHADLSRQRERRFTQI
jgi:hypothetical protein